MVRVSLKSGKLLVWAGSAAIANYLDQGTAIIDQMIEKVKAAIEKLTEYCSALITAAITGKIDVRNYSGDQFDVRSAHGEGI